MCLRGQSGTSRILDGEDAGICSCDCVLHVLGYYMFFWAGLGHVDIRCFHHTPTVPPELHREVDRCQSPL